jgi:signal transduction histidine kinase
LVAGPTPEPEPLGFSPVRASLAAAWACGLVAAAAVAALLAGVLALSERRAAFVSAVTHELRTPLTTFRMYAEMLAGGMVRDEDQRRHYLETLRREADRLSHLVENVLAYARLERGRHAGRIEEVTVEALIERAAGRLRERAELAGLRLEVAVDESAQSRRARADSAAVEQILFNLVDNASKYARPPGEGGVIHLEAALDEDMVLLRVRDHGPGISRRDERRLFRPFSKSAREAAHSAPGVGLGLALSRRLARELGGDLRLERQAAGGASFVLVLPAA